ncbi:hypothetical protein BGX21_003275 [Mortierella sp. AD011]|nr:hypothetical protein BGX20_001430 [Mortierella sp. AD010]KAF9377147.1 hypothetical protein BGX21_003275 [Mortierella sp. AD011]
MNNEPWIPLATEVLLTIPTNSVEQAYYGPYNLLLTDSFPGQAGYIVSPQTNPNSREAIDFLLEYVVIINRIPVMVVEVKRENTLQFEHARVNADLQVRDRFESMRNEHRLSETVGISIFGRFCRVYRYNRATQQITANGGDDLNQAHWNIDLHTHQGRMELAAVFEHVRQLVVQEL